MDLAVPPRLQVVSRSDWGARPPRSSPDVPAMVHPANVVYFTYTTGTSFCLDRESCSRVLREIQDKHMENGAADIAYKHNSSFLVGEDLALYEGRGWSKQPEKNIKHPDANGKLVEIAFIGDYSNQVLPYSLAKVALEFVGNSIKEQYLASTYRLKESHPKLNFDEE